MLTLKSGVITLLLRNKNRERKRFFHNTVGKRYGGVAQLGEHLPCKQGVMGSNPIISTTGEGPGAKIKDTRVFKALVSEMTATLKCEVKNRTKLHRLIAQQVRARA